MADTNDINRKSADAVTSDNSTDPRVIQLGLTNILNSYRSYNYNFTLATVRRTDAGDPTKYAASVENLTILKSGGKGTAAIQGEVVPIIRPVYKDVKDEKTGEITKQKTTATTLDSQTAPPLIDGFNKDSPGKFDMFIENVEIETTMAPSEQSNLAVATSVKFDVIEPYSINGFIEALHIASLAAGYPSYTDASIVLKIEFIGYPDKDSLPAPENIGPNGTRYFLIKIAGMEVDVNEQGTRYRCTAVPYEQTGFGVPNDIKKSISASGATVFDILKDLMDKVNQQVAEATKDTSTESSNSASHDKYSIVFPTVDPSSSTGLNYGQKNAIAKSDVVKPLKDDQNYAYPDPGDPKESKPNNYKATDAKQPTPQEQAKDPKAPQFTYSPGSASVQFAEGSKIHEVITAVIRDSRYVQDLLKNVNSKIDDYGFIDYFMVRIEVTNQDAYDDSARRPFQNFQYVVTPYKVHYTKIPGYQGLKIDKDKLTTLSLRQYNYIYTGQNVDIINFKLNFNNLYFEAIPLALGKTDAVPYKNTAAPNDTSQPTLKTSKSNLNADSNGQSTTRPDFNANAVQRGGLNGGIPSKDPFAILAKSLHEAVINSKTGMITGDIEIFGDPFFLVTGGIGNYVPKPSGKRGVAGDNEADFMSGQILITIVFNNPIDYGPNGMMHFDPNKVAFSGVYQVIKAHNIFKDGTFKQKLEIVRMPGQIQNSAPPDDPRARYDTSPNPEDKTVTAETPSVSDAGVRPNEEAAAAATPAAVGNTPIPTNPSGINQLSASSSIFSDTNPSAAGVALNDAGLVNAEQSSLANAAVINQASDTLQTITGNSNAASTLAASAGVNPLQLSNAASIPNSANLIGGIGGNVLANNYGTSSDPRALGVQYGINPNQVTGLSSNLTSKLLAQLAALPASIPKNTNIGAAVAQGIIVNQLTANQLSNLPATQPYATAPAAAADPARIAATLAVGLVNNLVASTSQNRNRVDSTVRSDKILAVNAQLTGLVGSPSREVTQSIAGVTTLNSEKVITSQFGSTSRTTSPLAKLLGS